MIRISILRLKLCYFRGLHNRRKSTNDKNLNSEIETRMKAHFTHFPMDSTTNDKNLNSEIETKSCLAMVVSHTLPMIRISILRLKHAEASIANFTSLTTNDKNLNSEIETDEPVQIAGVINAYQ